VRLNQTRRRAAAKSASVFAVLTSAWRRLAEIDLDQSMHAKRGGAVVNLYQGPAPLGQPNCIFRISEVLFSPDGARVGIIMQFNRIRGPIEDLLIWSATSNGFSFVISFETRSGPGLRGRPGYLASWRPIHQSRCAIKVGGSPFESLVEAEMACTATLAHLTRQA